MQRFMNQSDTPNPLPHDAPAINLTCVRKRRWIANRHRPDFT
ncbi:MAG: hypothetical protein PWP34_2642 [Desulfuromonadales bacterium]|jgi:hypothetical protein|nr:hypothetical protein [Desulfuromonadales bacterium]